MGDRGPGVFQPVEWGVAGQAMGGNAESGDQYLVCALADGLLLAVVDGLGHGSEAATAAKKAVAALRRHALESLGTLIARCHQDLVGTRGAVMSLARIGWRARTMTWLGVGNVTGLLVRNGLETGVRREWLLLSGGVVGFRLPVLRPVTLSLGGGETLILATDGIQDGFVEDLPLGASPQEMADHIFVQHVRGTDDALVLVSQFRDPAGKVPCTLLK